MQVPTVAAISPPTDLTLLRTASTSRANNPVRAIAPPKAMALIIKPTVPSMLFIPPLDSSSSKAGLSVTEVKPANIAINKPLNADANGFRLASAPRATTESH